MLNEPSTTQQDLRMAINFHGGDAESGEVFAVETRASAGYKLSSHEHSHPHLSVLVSGTAKVTIDGNEQVLSGYNMITVPAKTCHEVEALTDIIWLCLWADHLAPKEEAYESLKLVQA